MHLLLFGMASAWAQEEAPSAPTLSPEELAAIEAALGADQATAPLPPPPPPAARSVQSLNPDISVITDIALAWFSAEEPLMGGGHDPTVTGFNLQQVEMAISKPVDPYFRFDSNIVFSLFGVEVEEAYATTMALPGRFQIRVGQMLTRFGRINNTHPHSWEFIDQTFAIGRVFGGEGNRGLGMEASWLSPLPWYLEVVGSTTGAAGEASARSFYGSQDLGVETPLDFQNTLAIKQFFPLSPAWSLSWGLSGATGPNPTGIGNRTDVYGTDVYLKYKSTRSDRPTVFAIQSEWLLRRRQIPEDLLSDVTSYTQVFWRFAPRLGAAVRYEYGSPATGLDGEVASDPLDPEWTAVRHRVAGSMTFWPTEFSRLRAQADIDLPQWKDTPDYAVFIATEFNIGAHGAHAF